MIINSQSIRNLSLIDSGCGWTRAMHSAFKTRNQYSRFGGVYFAINFSLSGLARI